MQLRVARHTERLDEHVRFYRDGLGLRELGGFHEHDGYDGVFLEVPGTEPVSPANPYWSEHGTTFADPDGFHVVLVPEHWRA